MRMLQLGWISVLGLLLYKPMLVTMLLSGCKRMEMEPLAAMLEEGRRFWDGFCSNPLEMKINYSIRFIYLSFALGCP